MPNHGTSSGGSGGHEPPASKPPITEEERERRRKIARENGRKGGRPPKVPRNAEERLREVARSKGEGALVYCVDYWIELLRGEHGDATHGDRLRASENLANRCGLQIRTDITASVDIKTKLVNARGWRDAGGILRDEDGAPIDETAVEP